MVALFQKIMMPAERHASPKDLVAEAIRNRFPGRIALLSSFGTEAAVLLHMVAAVDPTTPVLFVDTGRLFGETLRYRHALAERLGLTEVRDVRPAAAVVARQDPDNMLFDSDPDACCRLRKVAPLIEAAAAFDALITGRRRDHGGTRANLPQVERAGHQVKVNPLARMDDATLLAYMRQHSLPQHPLAEDGYASVGCYPCTSRTAPHEGVRDGRWRGRAKTECGIHQACLRASG